MTWKPFETAPKEGEFWAKVGPDAVRVFWHPGFQKFITGWRRMDFAPGYSIEPRDGEIVGRRADGGFYLDHSPSEVTFSFWMPIPDDEERTKHKQGVCDSPV